MTERGYRTGRRSSHGAATTGRHTSHGAVDRIGSGAGRLARVWQVLPYERRLASFAAAGLFLTLFLPWYHETVVAVGRSASTSLTGWDSFSFVEAAVLVVAGGVLTLLFQRAEGRAFHVPGGDGWVITGAGFWTCVLVIWRIFDKQTVQVHGQGTTVSGIESGIFVALAVAGFLAYAGSRIRAAHQPEPPLPGEEGAAKSQTSPERPPEARPRVSSPRPVAADEAPTEPIDAAPTPATRRHRPVREGQQLTIPLDEGEPAS